jgi:nucleotide-binding universal stress UspA family protein
MRLTSTHTILVPTDFTAAADLAVDAAIELGELLHASIELLHVASDPTPLAIPAGEGGAVPMQIDVEAGLAAESARLDATAAKVRRRGLTCSVGLAMGRTHAEIIDHANKIGADLIVLGSHEHHGVAGAFLAHVAEKVVRHAPCPVLVVPLLERDAASIVGPDDALFVPGAALVEG